MGDWNEQQSVAALRAMEASLAEGLDPDTKRRLQRLSMTYWYASMGIERAGAAGKPAPALRAAASGRAQPTASGGSSSVG